MTGDVSGMMVLLRAMTPVRSSCVSMPGESDSSPMAFTYTFTAFTVAWRSMLWHGIIRCKHVGLYLIDVCLFN